MDDTNALIKQQVDLRLIHEKIKQFSTLKDDVATYDAQLKNLKQQKDVCEKELYSLMKGGGVENIKIDGKQYIPKTTKHISLNQSMMTSRDEIIFKKWIVEQGMSSLLNRTIGEIGRNGTFKAFIKEQMDSSEDYKLFEFIKIYNKESISVRSK